MAGGGPTMQFRGQKVPAVKVFGRMIPSHVYATAIYGSVILGVLYAQSGPKKAVQPKIGGSGDEGDFVRDFVAQMQSSQK